jgi:hypothetical protein
MITSATYQANEQVGATQYRVRVRLVTDDERGTFDQWFSADGQTVLEIRDDVSQQIAELNTRRTVKNVLMSIAAGTAIPVVAPAAAPATAFQVWSAKAARLVRAKSLGLTVQAAVDDVAALQNDVNATYVAGYVGQL